jgi:hypothetical protein
MFQQVLFSLISSPNNDDINLFKQVYIREKYSNIEPQEVEHLLITFSNSLQTFEPMYWLLKLHKIDTSLYQTLFYNLSKTQLYKNRNIPENYEYTLTPSPNFHQIQFKYLMEFYEMYQSYITPFDDQIIINNYNIYYIKWIYENFNVSYQTHLMIVEELLKTYIDVSKMDVFDFDTDTTYILYIREQPILQIVKYLFTMRSTWTTKTIQQQINVLKSNTTFYRDIMNIIY